MAADIKLAKLSDKRESSSYVTPEQILEHALESLRVGEGVIGQCDKLLVLALQTRTEDGKETFNIGFFQAQMHMSECVALCEIAKLRFANLMGYNLMAEDLERG